MGLTVQNRPKRPAAVGAVTVAFITLCAIAGGVAAAAVVEIATRPWPTGGPRG
jgi:hypothetical protein